MIRQSAQRIHILKLTFALTLVVVSTLNQSAAAKAPDEPAPQPADSYSESIRTSQYVTVRDGTRLAIDIYRPAVGGKPIVTKLPVILVATPYHRSSDNNGEILTFLAPYGNHRSIYDALLRHGYVIASLDIRGRGASFGKVYAGGMDADVNRLDLYDVIEWLAVQPWSDGNVGMCGCSYVARTQFWAASGTPPHLKAIAPSGSPFDTYALLRVNGVRQIPDFEKWDQNLQALDTKVLAAPVGEDKSGALRQAAIEEHRITWDTGLAAITQARAQQNFRDTPLSPIEIDTGPASEWNYLNNYRISPVPVFQFAGWRDFVSDASFTWFRSLAAEGVPERLTIGPWYHCEWDQSELVDATAEYLRWYDYWLKGIRNGAMDGPQIRYFVNGAPQGHEWRTADTWPLPHQTQKTYFFAGSAEKHEGTLSLLQPIVPGAPDHYAVDYSVTTAGLGTRFYWGIPNAPDPGLKPIEMAGIDMKSLTFTSAPLPHDVEITGFPKVTLWVTSTVPAQDFFVYLEVVDEKGISSLLTDGMIRASHRATRNPPFDNQGLPWHASLARDQAPLQTGVPAKVEVALFPMSNYVRQGYRLRVTVNSFDNNGWDTPRLDPAPTVSVFHDVTYQSSITLPFVPSR